MQSDTFFSHHCVFNNNITDFNDISKLTKHDGNGGSSEQIFCFLMKYKQTVNYRQV